MSIIFGIRHETYITHLWLPFLTTRILFKNRVYFTILSTRRCTFSRVRLLRKIENKARWQNDEDVKMVERRIRIRVYRRKAKTDVRLRYTRRRRKPRRGGCARRARATDVRKIPAAEFIHLSSKNDDLNIERVFYIQGDICTRILPFRWLLHARPCLLAR